jgi:HSP20 family protein
MNTLAKYTRDEFLSPFDRMFDTFFNDAALFPTFGDFSFSKGSYPKVDVVEYNNKIVLDADVGGLAKEDVSVDLEGDVLVIRGGKKQTTEDKDAPKGKYLYKEIKRSSFVRTFSLGENVDKNNIKVEFQNGIVKIELPKLALEEKKPERKKLL